ncbi:MAG: hypothetical protein GXX01_05350 [Clostridiales bacterium]|nr:hypothetical protein [Clostridiales bacterium]
MKIILSRKGFDNTYGGCASPILPDGTMLSMPIPSEDDDILYSQLQYKEINYADMLKQLNPRIKNITTCHLDPDIRPDIRIKSPENWMPAFGQIGSAQGLLRNAGVTVGDIFLFFGWFRRVKHTKSGYRFLTKDDSNDFYDSSDLHVIFGYMQIGRIITDQSEIRKLSWHPHASEERLKDKTNTIYIASEKLSICPDLPGYGTFDYRKDRVLTMEGKNRSVWNAYEFLMPDKIYGNRKNSAKDGGLSYRGIWQELIVNNVSTELLDWVISIIK